MLLYDLVACVLQQRTFCVQEWCWPVWAEGSRRSVCGLMGPGCLTWWEESCRAPAIIVRGRQWSDGSLLLDHGYYVVQWTWLL